MLQKAHLLEEVVQKAKWGYISHKKAIFLMGFLIHQGAIKIRASSHPLYLFSMVFIRLLLGGLWWWFKLSQISNICWRGWLEEPHPKHWKVQLPLRIWIFQSLWCKNQDEWKREWKIYAFFRSNQRVFLRVRNEFLAQKHRYFTVTFHFLEKVTRYVRVTAKRELVLERVTFRFVTSHYWSKE